VPPPLKPSLLPTGSWPDLSYRQIARIFKGLTLVLFAYVLAAFLARPDWWAVLTATLVPRIEWSNSYLATFVGILNR
jgi:Mn2+/Fe2+ NRAMP family transporter